MTYAEKLRDPRWQRRRLEIMQRDGFACRDCHAKEKTLNVHHCGYARDPWDAPENILRTLCEDCHQVRQDLEDDLRIAIARICNLMEPDYLKPFVKSAVAAIDPTAIDACGVSVMTNAEMDWDSNGRWFVEAYNNPDARPVYDRVTGRNVDWAKVDARKSHS